MAFPETIDTFPNMMDMTASDGVLIKQYQTAMENGDLFTARQILAQIPNNQNKIITADYLNSINAAIVAMENYAATAYSSGYVVSSSRPINQQSTDFWFQVT